jgi:hypothetical protein
MLEIAGHPAGADTTMAGGAFGDMVVSRHY